MVYEVITLIAILPNKMNLSKQNFSWRHISQSEIRNLVAESEGGQKSKSLILVPLRGIEPLSGD